MNVSCPECQSVFRVDPARVPGPGIRARCSVCGGIIPITATRSWTDDFATPHDAASLTAGASRGTSRAAAGPAAFGEPAAVAPSLRAPGGAPSSPFASPAAGPSRPVTPARVPLFSPGRKPTPTSSPSVGAPPSLQSPQPAPASNAASLQPPMPAAAPRPVPPAPITGAPGAAPASHRVSEAPIGAPISRPSAPAQSSPVTSGQRPSAPPVRDAGSSARAIDANPLPSASGAGVSAARPAGDASPGARPINPFLANDPNQKAKRLARALVSDMVAYHPQKRDEGVRAGTLKQLFREEIKKSYEEYVDQIGKEFAESTSHFQDALNDVLAGGKKVF